MVIKGTSVKCYEVKQVCPEVMVCEIKRSRVVIKQLIDRNKRCQALIKRSKDLELVLITGENGKKKRLN